MTKPVPHQPEGVGAIKAPYSLVVSSDDLVFVSGQIAIDAEGNPGGGDFGQQMRQTMDNLNRCLAAAGCGFEDVVKLNAFLASYDDYEEYNRIYAEYFSPPYPARTTVRVDLLGFLIEIDAVARLGRKDGSQ